MGLGGWRQSVVLALSAWMPAAVALPTTTPDDLFQMDLEELLGVRISQVGLGETRQLQRLDASEARRYPAGTSPLKLLDRLPGVHFTNADAHGSYGWAKRLSIRGFTQNQLGFTLDRVPLGDHSYGNHNGLHVSRALIAENLGVIELAQGGGTLGTASAGNLGGTVRILGSAPAAQRLTRVEQTLGSDNARRSFVRLDTGKHRGGSAYLSAMHHDTDKWKGWGPQRQSQLNGKLVRDWQDLTLTAFVAISRRAETDYIDLSLASTRAHGFDWDYYAPDWQRAIDAAIALCGEPAAVECDDAYYLGRGLRDDDLAYLTVDWRGPGRVGLLTTVYGHRNHGQGHWVTPYEASAEVPMSLRVSEYDIDRWGVLPTLSVAAGVHRIEAGLWVERNLHDFNRYLFELQRDHPPNRAAFQRNPRETLFGQRFGVDTLQWFLQDRISLLAGALTLDLGFKGTRVDYRARRLAGSDFAEGELRASDSFLPQASMRYRISTRVETFLAYGENISVYRAGITGPFSTTQAAFDAFKDQLAPETSRTVEGGLRFSSPRFQGSLAIYDVLFEDRLLQIVSDVAILGSPSVFANVGAVQTRGAEAAGAWKIADGIEWYNAIAYNDSRYADDYLSGGTLVPTDGKRVVDSPRLLASSNLSWKVGQLDLRLGAKYTGPRYISYLNDSQVAGYTIANAALNYRLENIAWASAAELQFSVTNLFDRKHHATVGTNNFATSDPEGLLHTLSAGAKRQFFVTARFEF